jgi:hypothetical protein
MNGSLMSNIINLNNDLTPLSETDYDTIATAVMETDRGRWFLFEYARRNRNADTQVVLDSINRLQHALTGRYAVVGETPEAADLTQNMGQENPHNTDKIRLEIVAMATAIYQMKAELAAVQDQAENQDQAEGFGHTTSGQQTRLQEASAALDSIIKQTEQATSSILSSAEHIQETAWTMREEGVDSQYCDTLDQDATDIYTSCSFQDLTSQKITKIVAVLRYLEERINAITESISLSETVLGETVLDEAALSEKNSNIPAPQEHSRLRQEAIYNPISQTDVDGMILEGVVEADSFESSKSLSENEVSYDESQSAQETGIQQESDVNQLSTSDAETSITQDLKIENLEDDLFAQTSAEQALQSSLAEDGVVLTENVAVSPQNSAVAALDVAGSELSDPVFLPQQTEAETNSAIPHIRQQINDIREENATQKSALRRTLAMIDTLDVMEKLRRFT